jgi:energy-coupling factor transport system ATP-binding protein
VVLAAIVASHAPVVVLDEPLAGLDPQGRAEIVELLARLRNSGLTLIVISHDVHDMAAVCDRTVHLEAGRILETDPIRDTANVAAHQLDAHTMLPGTHPGDPAWRLGNGGR